ncbi:MAG: hypothetical protein U0P30_11570 [Vicinamibacterales bacterium]
MHRRAFLTGLASLALAAPLAAHEGHDHKLLGTIAELSAGRLVVKAAKDGARTTVVLTPATLVRRGKTVVAVSALAVGERVVVNIGSGKAPITAKAIDAGPPTAGR